jgi:hypothetical protein
MGADMFRSIALAYLIAALLLPALHYYNRAERDP